MLDLVIELYWRQPLWKPPAMQNEGSLALLNFLPIMTTASSSVGRSYLVKPTRHCHQHKHHLRAPASSLIHRPFQCRSQSGDIILNYRQNDLLKPKEA